MGEADRANLAVGLYVFVVEAEENVQRNHINKSPNQIKVIYLYSM